MYRGGNIVVTSRGDKTNPLINQTGIDFGTYNNDAGARSSAKIKYGSEGTANYLYDTYMSFWTYSATGRGGRNTWTDYESMRIDSAGNVGIGTTSPGAKLDVAGAVTVSTATANTGYGMQLKTGIGLNLFSDSNTSISVGSVPNAFYIAGTSGNVGIGTTTPGYKLTVNGQPGANGYTAFTNYSDARLKTNINYLSTGYLDKIMQLKPTTFNYNALSGYDEATRARLVTGFIAQDLQSVFPEMVGETIINGTKYFDTNLSALSIYLVKGMQEQQTQITSITNNQNKIVEQLTGQLADQSLSVDSKLQLIGSSLDELTINQIKKIKDQILENKASISSVSADLKILQDQYATIQDQYSTLSEILLVADGVYDFKKGILKSSGIVAGAFTVKVTPDKPKTIGEAYVCPVGFTGNNCDIADALADGKSVLVDTKMEDGTLSAITATAKIFINFENNPKAYSWTEKEKVEDHPDLFTGKFKIFLDQVVTTSVKVNWWIVEKE